MVVWVLCYSWLVVVEWLGTRWWGRRGQDDEPRLHRWPPSQCHEPCQQCTWYTWSFDHCHWQYYQVIIINSIDHHHFYWSSLSFLLILVTIFIDYYYHFNWSLLSLILIIPDMLYSTIWQSNTVFSNHVTMFISSPRRYFTLFNIIFWSLTCVHWSPDERGDHEHHRRTQMDATLHDSDVRHGEHLPEQMSWTATHPAVIYHLLDPEEAETWSRWH